MKKLVLFLTLIFSSNVFACSCMKFDVVEFLKFSNKVYVGKVINIQKLGNEGRMSAALSVTEKFVGQPFDVEEVITGTSNCSADFSVNITYLVFENKNGYVSMCSMMELKYVPNLKSNLEALRHIRKFGI
ncbi:hypothetical protein [Paraglaciecola sp.]|uniref:hypothetical protein n=1 Tax=Paraglaciecola sp. TaxID=1920173 RepID=UPI003EF75C69